jgi:L-ascorbate metabolism protein UlaG (beta-lactamase superfamily)
MTRSSPPPPEASLARPDSPLARPESPLRVTFLGHATVLLELSGLRILTDPFLRSSLGPLQRHGPTPDPRELGVDAVVISHGHPDHFDRRSIEALPGVPTIVVPRGLASALAIRSSRSQGAVREVTAGEVVRIGDATIRAVGARHWVSPGAPRAQPVGYVIETRPAGTTGATGARAYFAGDTGRFDELASVVGEVDLALLPVWTWGPHLGPGHLGPRSAAEVARELRPAAAVPIHWGTLYPHQLHRVWKRALREPGDRFAAYARRIAPEVDVRVLRPGETTTIDLARR